MLRRCSLQNTDELSDCGWFCFSDAPAFEEVHNAPWTKRTMAFKFVIWYQIGCLLPIWSLNSLCLPIFINFFRPLYLSYQPQNIIPALKRDLSPSHYTQQIQWHRYPSLTKDMPQRPPQLHQYYLVREVRTGDLCQAHIFQHGQLGISAQSSHHVHFDLLDSLIIIQCGHLRKWLSAIE